MDILNIGASFLVEALRQQGHRLVSVGLSADCDIRLVHPVNLARLMESFAESGFKPEACLWMDNGNLPFVLGMEEMPCPSLFYTVDTFCNPWHVPFAYAFDRVLVAQKGHVPLFPPHALAQWLPLFAPATIVSRIPVDRERDIPAVFVGSLRPRNIPQRFTFLQQFQQLHPLILKEGDYVPLFSRAHIVLNQTAASEVNFRCFEAMACGAALLTEESAHGLTELFTPGVHILPLYPRGDAGQAADIARAWLHDPDALRRVAKAGCELVRSRHTTTERAAHVAALLREACAEAVHLPRLHDIDARRRHLSTAYGILAAELTDPGMRDHRAMYRRVFEWMA